MTGGHSFHCKARRAHLVELCLFSSEGAENRRPMIPQGDDLWFLQVPDVGPGQRYGFRVHRPGGNPAKLLLDPYGRRVEGTLAWHDALLAEDPRDSAPYVPKAVVVGEDFDWGDDAPPRTPWSDTVLYEAHVRGLTRLHPEVVTAHRGRFLGLASEPVLTHLRRLGVTAVELMPVQHFISERFLTERGLVNYWGYNPLAFFAPHAGYATVDGDPVREFKTMVRRLHQAGLEVILDVVFNHTAEGGDGGPTLSLKGLDPRGYYRRDDNQGYVDFSGCGNTLDFTHPETLRLVLDCLRYWVEAMHVDGFRFDLAPILGRRSSDHGAVFDPKAPEVAFFRAVAADPLLAEVKWIAEPWDLGPGGYQLGALPPPWLEWNDRFRDTVRSYWRGDPGRRGAFATRVAGSRDLFPKRPGIHMVTCHDGFTLRDLVSYREKHNHANSEDNRDGHNHNVSDNLGVEGPTRDPHIRALRRRRERTFLASLFLSRGVPMLSHGDEWGRSQGGNNNAYCQDNATTWVVWRSPKSRHSRQRLTFLRRLAALRRRFSILRAGPFPARWRGTEGSDLRPEDWRRKEAGSLLLQLGELLLLYNPETEAVTFPLPPPGRRRHWHLLLDSSLREKTGPRSGRLSRVRKVAAGAVVVLRRRSTGLRRTGL